MSAPDAASRQARSPSGASVKLDGVSLVAGDGNRVLSSIDWELAAGDAASVVGPSGSGKSTLLRLINRLDDPTDGVVCVGGRDVREWKPRALRQAAVWVPQSPALSPLPARNYLDVPVELGVIEADDVRERRPRALEVAQFPDSLLNRNVERLSGGERLRLALARALQLSPRLLLVDEPTSSLDGETGGAVLGALGQHCRQRGITLVVVTHRLADVRTLGGQVLLLEDGQVAASGAANEVLADEGERIRRVLSGEGS